MPVCAVLDCGNGEYKLNRWKSYNCMSHPGFKKGVGQCICPPPFVLYPFPTERRNPEGRKKWIQLLNRKDKATGKNWLPKPHSRVCSIHFPDGSPTGANPNPTLNLGYPLFVSPKSTRKLPTTRTPTTSVKHLTEESISELSIEDPVPADTPTDPVHSSITTDHGYSLPDSQCEQCNVLSKLLKECQHEAVELRQKLAKSTTGHHTITPLSPNTTRFVVNDNKVRLNTGIPNKGTLDALYKHLSPKVKRMRYWAGAKKVTSTKVPRAFKRSPQKCGPQRKLSGKEELVLVLMKLRLGLTNDFLCDLFDVGKGTCSQIINTWVRFLSRELRPLVFWPDRITITKMLPTQLAAKYPSLRCTLDCTEVFIERPRHMELQSLTWSDYKKHNTAKYLIGIAPNGMISFLSVGWGGRTSDKRIVNESGFLDLVDPGDVILADRGFTINSELLMRHAKLEIPPPSSGWEQQTAEDVAKTKKVANARIHVERAIGRMKWFVILKNTVPINLVPILDDIVLVCAALCNLLPPLVGQ